MPYDLFRDLVAALDHKGLLQRQVRDQWDKYGLPPLRDKPDVY